MTIQDIKNRLTIAEVVKHYGLKADKQNRLKCPFYEDKTPSLQQYYKTQTAFAFLPTAPHTAMLLMFEISTSDE